MATFLPGQSVNLVDNVFVDEQILPDNNEKILPDYDEIKNQNIEAVSVDLRVNRISVISGHMHRLEARHMRRGASGTPACACLPNDAYAQRWRLIRQTVIYLQPLVFTAENIFVIS